MHVLTLEISIKMQYEGQLLSKSYGNELLDSVTTY